MQFHYLNLKLIYVLPIYIYINVYEIFLRCVKYDKQGGIVYSRVNVPLILELRTLL